MRTRIPALSACVLAMLVLAIRPAHPQTLMGNSRIAFVTNRDGNAEIYVMRVDGSDLVNLTNNPAADIDPAWSPQGDRIAFASDRDGDFDIYVMDRDGSNVARLAGDTGTDLHPSWSPDGERITFSSNRSLGIPKIYTMHADGSNQTQISETAFGGTEPSWSPNISSIVFTRPVGNRKEVARVGPLGHTHSKTRATAVHAGPRIQRSAAVSPNGREIIWEEKTTGGDYDIWTTVFGSSTPEVLTEGPPDDGDPSWAPDGTSMTFRRDGDIWRMRMADSKTTRLTATSGLDRDPVWSPLTDLPVSPLVNTRIAFLAWTNSNGTGIHIADYDGTNEHWIVRHADSVEWSPDGTQIVFSTTYEPPLGGQLLNSDIWIIDADGSDPFPVTSDPKFGPDDTYPRWSPDGSQIVFVSDRDGNRELYVVRSDGTDARRLTFTSDDEEVAVWSPDGTRIAFTSVQNYGLFVMDLDDGRVTRIPTAAGRLRNPAWSPDGARIAMDGITIVDVESPHTQVWGGAGERPAWSPDGTKIACLSDRDTGNSDFVYVMNVDGSQPRRWSADSVPHHGTPTWPPFLGPDAARITILNPADSRTLPFNTKSLTFHVDIDLHSGGWRWRANARFPTQGPIGGNVGDDSRQVTLSNLVPGKTYTIRTALVDDAGELLSANATHTVTFSVAAVPIVEITSPGDGESFSAGTRDVPLSVGIQHHDAHWHWRVNEAFPGSGLAGGNHVDASSSATISEIRDGVTYTVHAALVDDEHNLLDPSIVTSSTFTTGDPTYIIGTVLPNGLSLFALPLAAERLRFFGMVTTQPQERQG